MFKQIFQTYNNRRLVEIAERKDDYILEAREMALILLSERKVHPASIKKFAGDFWKNYVQRNFRQIIYSKHVPDTHFLKPEEMENIFSQALNYHRERQKLFEIDIEKYWGAAL